MKPRLPLDGGWTLWSWVCVRGAGFPVDGVLRLAAPELAAQLAALRKCDDELAAAMARAAEALHAATRTAPADGKRLGKALKRLRAGELPEPLDGYEPLLEETRAKAEAQQQQARALEAAWQTARRRTSDALREVAADRRFREAVLWQSRGAVRGSIDALLRQPPGASDDKTRQQEQLVASYWQRYCTKNDTIGFFGPVGWGRLRSDGPALTVRPGRTLLARRAVYFEHWAMQALADRLSLDDELRLLLPPRRHPAGRVDGNTLELGARRFELPEPYARLLALADGARSEHAIAEELLADASLELESIDDVLEMMQELQAKRLLHRGLALPSVYTRPERALARALAGVGDAEPVRRAQAALDELETARAAVEQASASDDEATLSQAMSALTQTFERLTGAESSRMAGATYGARTVVYEDCRRDLELELGPALRERVAPALAILLQAARWYTHAIATRFRALLVESYRQVRASSSGPIPYAAFAERALGHFTLDAYAPSSPVLDTVAELQRRFGELLQLDGSVTPVERQSEKLRAHAAALFAAPHPGWPSAREHAPDLLVAAHDLSSFERGQARFVLGELHVAVNTLIVPAMWQQHPEPEELIVELEQDFPEPRVSLVLPSENVHRSTAMPLARHDLEVETGAAPSPRSRALTLQASELMVDEKDGIPRIFTRDGSRSFDLIEFFDQYLTFESAGHFDPLAPAAHTPRVSIDSLVIARERWRLAAAEVTSLFKEAPLERWRAVQELRRTLGLPRQVFVRVPEERKPVYIDFDSTVFVEMLVRLLRKASRVTITEMLPGPDESWLPDHEGRRYTSELRLIAVDPEPWRRP